MADSDTPTPGTGQQAGRGATGDAAGGPLPLRSKPGTASRAREPCEKDDGMMVKNPQVMEDFKKAVEKKKKREQAAAEGGNQDDTGSSTSGDKVEGKAPAKP
ncbi:uncharacterized protein LOC119723369 [Patiria miniata]|uniref:Uncharacterized protein n=1 Tax=Patiria miniata TaxID=46514 RepID=A0A913ZEJ7_PATMI|nr:uncharacterized protein LOC119723369 [Patiria miniata]